MSGQDWRERISVDPSVCHAKPRMKGTRTMASIILDYLSAGEPQGGRLSRCILS